MNERNSNLNKNLVNNNVINNNNTKNINNKSHAIKEKSLDMNIKQNHNKSLQQINPKTKSSHSSQKTGSQQSSQQLTRIDRNDNNINNFNNNNQIEIGYDRTPVGSDRTPSPNFIESYDTPPYVRWSQDFRYLIDDTEGRHLFKQYLQSNGMEDLLDFWFACEGLKNENNKDIIKKFINVIFKKFIIKSQVIQLSEKVKTCLMNAKTNSDLEKRYDQHIFDDAQSEVEEQMKNSIYINFLKSEIYIGFLNRQLVNNQCLGAVGGYDSPKGYDESLSEPESFIDDYNSIVINQCVLPTVHEDAELQTSSQSTKTDDYSVNLSNDMRPHFQVINYPIDDAINFIKNTAKTQESIRRAYSQRSSNGSSRLMTESHPLSPNSHRRARMSYFKSKAMPNPPNPYHVNYATILPTSAQDSELQSRSSHSTSESIPCVSGGDNRDSKTGLYSLPNNKMRRNNAKVNAINNPNSGQPIDLHMTRTYTMPPKPLRDPVRPENQHASRDPEGFAAALIEKLKIIENENSNIRKLNETLDLNNPNSQSTDNNSIKPKSKLKDALPQFNFTPDDSAQSILDKHIAQVFSETPNETPTDPQLSVGGCVSPPKHNQKPYYEPIKSINSNFVSVGTTGKTNSLNDPSVITVTVKYSTEQIPYKVPIRGPNITFLKFKQHIPPKNGYQWQYYFKRQCNQSEMDDISHPFVYEKITEDNQVLPQIDGKIFAVLEAN